MFATSGTYSSDDVWQQQRAVAAAPAWVAARRQGLGGPWLGVVADWGVARESWEAVSCNLLEAAYCLKHCPEWSLLHADSRVVLPCAYVALPRTVQRVMEVAAASTTLWCTSVGLDCQLLYVTLIGCVNIRPVNQHACCTTQAVVVELVMAWWASFCGTCTPHLSTAALHYMSCIIAEILGTPCSAYNTDGRPLSYCLLCIDRHLAFWHGVQRHC